MNKTPFHKGLIFVLIAALLVGGVLLFTRVIGGDAFSREEAQHGLFGLWITRDIQTLDWGNFWYDTQRQMNWPFLHSWILSLFFLIFGAGYTSARLLSLLLFVATIVLMYLLANKLCREKGWQIGILACVLGLTSPMVLRFATENMLEGLGVVLFLAAAYLYTVCEERKDMLHYILLTLLFGLALYTNYIYAYFIVPSFIVMTVSKLGPIFFEAHKVSRQGEKAALHFVWWAYRKLIVLGFVLLFLGGWFSFHFSRKFMLLMNYIFKYSGGLVTQSFWEGLFYYPQVIINHLTFSPVLGFFLLLSLFLPFIAVRYRHLNRLYVYAWTPLVLATFTVPTKAPQMIYIIVPFIFLIFSAVAMALISDLKQNSKRFKILMALLVIVLLSSSGRLYSSFAGQSGENMKHVLAYYYSAIPDKQANVATIFNLQHLNPEGVKFHFRDWQGRVMADLDLSEEELLADGEYFLTLLIDEDSAYQKEVTDDSIYRWNAWLKEKEMEGKIRLFDSRRFDQIKVTANIFLKLNQ
ncbi:MAG: glycosyltransferase family 39 protein [bacterium]